MPDTTFIDGAALVAVIAGFGAAIRLVIKVTRVIDGQLQAMESNTTAVNQLSEIMGPLHTQVKEHEDRLDVIEPAVFPSGIPKLKPRRSTT